MNRNALRAEDYSLTAQEKFNYTPPLILSQWDKILTRQEESQKICALDPLQVDAQILLVKDYNKNKDINALKKLLEEMLPSRELVISFSFEEAAAAMRDLGIVLGSIKRQGLEPAEVLPKIEDVLFLLGKKLEMPPRDTVISYTLWNPSGARERTYTDHVDESHLIQSVRQAMVPLESAIKNLEDLHQRSPLSLEYSQLCEQAMANFRPMIDGVVYAKKNVSPKIFALELRHYFDAIFLREKKYLGPGAVEMPMFVFEHLLWSSDNTDPEFKNFKEGYLPYIFPNLRKIYDVFKGEKSLVSKMSLFIENHSQNKLNLHRSARALLKLCSQVRGFRVPHTALAASAYEEGVAQRDHGSGGYSIETLYHIDELMKNTVKEMRKVVEEKSKTEKKEKRPS